MKDNHTTPAHFELFKKECRKWIELFGLDEWKIYFLHLSPPDSKRLAGCNYEGLTFVATFVLNKNWRHDKPNNNWVKMVAHHEVVHLLIAQLNCLATSRYVTEDEVENAVERLVHKIEAITDKLDVKPLARFYRAKTKTKRISKKEWIEVPL